MSHIQNTLSEAQAFPVLGPLFVSPIKAALSLSELVVGVAGTIIFGPITALTLFSIPPIGIPCLGITYLSFHLAQEGLRELAYSIINFLSVGIIGYLSQQFGMH